MTVEKINLFAELYSLQATTEQLIKEHFAGYPEYLNSAKRERWEELSGIIYCMADRLKIAQEYANKILHEGD